MYPPDKYNELVGQQVLLLEQHGDGLLLQTERGYYLFTPYGDWWAHAYVSDVVNAADIVSSVITEIVEKEAPNYTPEVKDHEDVVDAHFYSIKTAKGYADIILHVDNNGYYGGELGDLSGPTDDKPGAPNG